MKNEEGMIHDLIENYEVSPEQALVVLSESNCVVRACPGSGKTRTVGTRLAHRMERWSNRQSGIAVISFTNVAAKEIADELDRLGLPRTVPPPHFLGTIHSFFDQVIFMPHGHRVMRPNLPPKKPELVLDFNRTWIDDTFTPTALKKKGFHICDFHFQADGSILHRGQFNRGKPSTREMSIARQAKLKMARAGYATQADTMYWSMKVVQSYPAIVRAAATRFSEIIVDEFQDTSTVQLQILKEFVNTGDCSLMLVGDPHQSIYGFNEACPEVLIAPESALGGTWSHLELTRNYRSSQLICDVAHHFCNRDKPDQAYGQYKDCNLGPMAFYYPDRQVAQILDTFAEILDKFGIPQEEGAVLTRTNATVRRLNGVEKLRNFPGSVPHVARMFMHVAYYRDNKQWKEASSGIEHTLLSLLFDEFSYGPNREALGDISFREWKCGCSSLLMQLPRTDLSLHAWLAEAKTVFAEYRVQYAWKPSSPIHHGRIFPNARKGPIEQPVEEFVKVSATHIPFETKTIHQAKGESHLVTMLVATPELQKSHPSDAHRWFLPAESNRLCPESVRQAFVALTRPRKLALVAIPESAWSELYDQLESCGFDMLSDVGSGL